MTQLNYFVEVCEKGSISKASQVLHISKQGLSQSIQSLEEELCFPLLIRTLSGIQLTAAGRSTYRYAKDILESYRSMLQTLEQDGGQAVKKLSIAFTHGFFACVPVDLLLSFIAANPGLQCEQYGFKDMDLRQKFVEKHLDLALCSGSREDVAFEYFSLFRNRRCLYVNSEHPFAQKQRISVDELKGELIGVPGEGYYDSPFILEQCRRRGFEPRLFSCEGLDVITQFAQAGRGVSLVVDNLDPDSIPAGLHRVYFEEDEAFSYDVYILTAKGKPRPEVQSFIQHAQRYCDRLKAKRG